MNSFAVKIDEYGRVTAFAPGPARDGWEDVSDVPTIRTDPLRYRRILGIWVEMSEERQRERDLDHDPPPVPSDAQQRLADLKGRTDLTADELHQAVLDIVSTL